MPSEVRLEDLSPATPGVLPNQILAEACAAGWIEAGDFRMPEENIQPASVDLRLGETAYRMRCSFLPHDGSVEEKVKNLIVDELDLRREGAVLETNRPYLIPLLERVHLPSFVSARANPKSSTGRADVFTRVISDASYKFDDVQPGYDGPLYLEVVPLSFAVRVRQGLSLNQLRLSIGSSGLSDDELWAMQETDPLLFRDGRPARRDEFATDDGLFLSLDLRGTAPTRNVGWRAKGNAGLLDLSQIGTHRVSDFWEPVVSEDGARVVLDPERFYLLLSEEAVRVPPSLASEMTAYDPTSGELRTHYAGFFDPGFGHADDALTGSRAALEVRAHDVPFMIEHGQRVVRLTFERMVCEPTKLYGGAGLGSNYQGQVETLGKHFARG